MDMNCGACAVLAALCLMQIVTSQNEDTSEAVYACDSPVYCHGELLDSVQKAELFNDSKTFVDMPMRVSQDVVLENFRRLYSIHGENMSPEILRNFVDEHFEEEGHELEKVELEDFKPRPYLYYKIDDVKLRIWANELNMLWNELGRKIKADEEDNNGSLIYVPNAFVVPGGRFREFYYWDSYWIMEGLLVCGMKDTVRGMIENFLSMVERYGFVPNGGRIYYTRRTQPPLLIHMMSAYFHKSQDIKFLKQNIDTLEREYRFWTRHRTVIVRHEGRTYGLARYQAQSNMPRPEGYREDVALQQEYNQTVENGHCDVDSDLPCNEQVPDGSAARTLLQNVASACESGWDFSSRWFSDYTHLTSIDTQNIVPVDLNSFLCANERLLSKLYEAVGDTGKASMYERSYQVRREAIHAILWDEQYGVWFDYDVTNKKRRQAYYISNFLPLHAHCFQHDTQIDKVLKYIEDLKLAEFPGGVPTSLARHVSEQWDFPNAWPPSVHLLVNGLADTGHVGAQEMALRIAQTWISSNYKAWTDHRAMFEKYDAEEAGRRGGGGEYDVQTGFGWTNGVVLSLLDRFGMRLEASPGRDLVLGMTPEVLICIVVVLLVVLVIVAGSLTYLRKRHKFQSQDGGGGRGSIRSSNSGVGYSPVNTNDNHVTSPDRVSHSDRDN